MGCASSTSGQNPSSGGTVTGVPADFNQECDLQRNKFDKKTGQAVPAVVKDRPETVSLMNDLNRNRISSQCKKPAKVSSSWLLSPTWAQSLSPQTVSLIITNLTIDNPVNNNPPDANYVLEYAYGYKCDEARQNVFLGSDGKVIYMTAALGIMHDFSTNKQTIFGGG